MSSSNEPENMQQEKQTGTTEAPEAANQPENASAPSVDGEETIHLPEPKNEPRAAGAADADLTDRFRLFDVVLVAVLALLGFFLASFQINNSDFWLHLATGRYLSQNFGGLYTDPFTFTAGNMLWVNNSWLFDLLIYGLYNLGGGPALVIARGAVIVVLVVILLQTAGQEKGLWISVVCVLIALVAMSPRLLFQPTLFSLLFLAATIFLVYRPPVESGEKKSFAHLWLLAPLFVLWVNIDVWFVLGPITLALALAGQGMQVFLFSGNETEGNIQRQKLKMLGLVFLVGLGACLVNPYFFRTYRLPAELAYLLNQAGVSLPDAISGNGSTVATIEQYEPSLARNLSRSIFSAAYAEDLRERRSLTAIAHLLLVVMGLLSFVALLVAGKGEERSFPVWSNLLIWLFFTFLSLLMIRLVPLFAVAAAPITALNWREAVQRLNLQSVMPGRLSSAWNIVGRLATLAVLLGLLYLVWPGWLRGVYGSGNSRYRVDWSIDVNPGLKETADLLAKWHKEGKVSHVFNAEPHMGCYLAWFSPGVKYFYDYRYELITPKATELGKILRSFWGEPKSKNEQLAKYWQELQQVRDKTLKADDISYVVFSSPGKILRAKTASGPWRNPRQWQLACGNSQTMVFRWWPDPTKVTRAQKENAGINYEQLAFGISPKQARPTPAGVAFPEKVEFWKKYLFGMPSTPLELEKSDFYLGVHSHKMSQMQQQGREFVKQLSNYYLFTFCDALLATASDFASAPGNGAAHTAIHTLTSMLPRPTPTPPVVSLALPLLAVRNARAAVKKTPDQPTPYLILATALSRQWITEQSFCDPVRMNRNRALETLVKGIDDWVYWANTADQPLPSLRFDLRRTNTTAAYYNLMFLNDDNPIVHWTLAQIYLRQNYCDIALHHMERARDLLANKSTTLAVKKEFRQHVEQFTKSLAGQVKERQNFFRLQVTTPNPVQKFHEAIYKKFRIRTKQGPSEVPLGLAGEALKVAEQANWNKLSRPEKSAFVQQQLMLYLSLGRMKEVYDLLEKHKTDGLLPPEAADEAGLRLAAAMGDYQTFDTIAQRREQQQLEGIRKGALPRWFDLPLSVWPHPARVAITFKHQLQMHDLLLQYVAEIRLARGLMALEAGDVAKAKAMFQKVIDVAKFGGYYQDGIIAAKYLQQIEAANHKQ